MKEENKHSFKYELKDEFKYPANGQLVYAKFLEFYPPSAKHFGTAARLQQMYTKPLMDEVKSRQASVDESATSTDSDDTDQKSLNDAYFMIFMSGCSDIQEASDLFESLLKSGCCKIDGENAIRGQMLDGLSYNDKKYAMKEYLNTFLPPEVSSADQ